MRLAFLQLYRLGVLLGIVWLLFLISVPLAYLFVIGTLRAMDASLEEASRSAGASSHVPCGPSSISLRAGNHSCSDVTR